MSTFISKQVSKDDELSFTIDNANVSFVNGIRRVLLSEIPTVVFRTSPYEKNDCIIKKNTSQFNNEILKQRLSCIPIHINDLTIPVNKLILHLKVKNDGLTTRYVTSEDFKIWNEALGKYLPDEKVKNIFPYDKISKGYIEFVCLKPPYLYQSKENNNGEEIDLECRMSIDMAKTNGMFNVVSKATFRNKLLPKEVLDLEYEKYEKSVLEKETISEEELAILKQDWFTLNCKRHFVDDCFEFTLKSIGVFSNEKLIEMACEIMKNKLLKIRDKNQESEFAVVEKNMVFSENCFDIILKNEDYTIGKIIEHMFYLDEDNIEYISFLKKHPHDKDSKIIVVYKGESRDETSVVVDLKEKITKALTIIETIVKGFIR